MADERSLTSLVEPLRGGKVTIPAEFRRRLGISEGTMLRLTLVQGELRLAPVDAIESGRGSPWLRDLYELYAPVRDEIREREIPEADVNADIDAAVRAVREAQRPEPQ